MHEVNLPGLPERLLLVAGDPQRAHQLELQLRGLGSGIPEVAGDVFEARQRCTRLLPELILIDLELAPNNAAFDVAAALSGLTSAPILFVCEPNATPSPRASEHAVGCVETPLTRERLLRSLLFGARWANEQESARAHTFHNQFLASMAHELRAPLQGVSGFTSFLIDGKAGPVTEAQRACLEQIGSGAEHVLQIVQDVLDMSDSGAGALQVRAEVVDAEQAAREVLQVLQVIAFKRRITVQVQVDDRLGHVISDATKIKQILYNFVSNALKYTPAGGRVDIRLRRDDADSFSVEVGDTGPGLPAHILARGFAKPGDARGHGLSLAHRIAVALGGTISARNEQTGAVLCARLPIAPSVVAPDPAVPLPRGVP